MATRFLLGDCLSVLKTLKADSAQLVLGSPPYPLKGDRYDDEPLIKIRGANQETIRQKSKKFTVEEWIDFMLAVANESTRIAPVALFVVNDTYRDGQFHPAVDGLLYEASRSGHFLERPLIWHKNAPPNRRDWWCNCWERVICFKREPGPVPTWNPEKIGTPPKYKAGGDFRQRDSKGKRRKGGKYPTNKVTQPRDVLYATIGGGHMGHPLSHENEAPFPESLILPIVEALTNEGDTVIDPFYGSGTTLAVAAKLGRDSIGIELRESQEAIARERLKTL